MCKSSDLIFCTSGCFLFFHEGHKELLSFLLELSQGSQIYIGINSDEYLYRKHSEKLKNILDDSSIDKLEKLSLHISLDADTRKDNVKFFVKNSAKVIITDDLLDYVNKIKSKNNKIVWVVGDDYVSKDFKERDLVSAIYITPRTTKETSSEKLNKIQEKNAR